MLVRTNFIPLLDACQPRIAVGPIAALKETEFSVEGGSERADRDYMNFTAVPYTSISAAPCMTVAEV